MSQAEERKIIGENDLQLLLQPRLGKSLTVLRTTVSSLLPPGENFASQIFKVNAVVKRDASQPEEELHLVGKMFPDSAIVRKAFDFPFFFKKEIFFYEKLAPALRQLEIDLGIAEDEAFDIAPRVYGARFSADPQAKDVDDGAILLMENLKTSEYYTLDKIEGMDIHHARYTIKTLARFHGLGIACKRHRADFFQREVLSHAKTVTFKEDPNEPGVFALMFDMMYKDARIAEHGERIRALTGKKEQFFRYVAEEPWLSICHLDFWTNNILYRKDAAGRLDAVKFVDFQNYAYNSPLRDLPYLLCTSTTHEVMTRHLDELLDLYYETFIGVLKRMGCDAEAFSRVSFERQLKIDAGLEFFHNILAIKFFCAEIDKNTYEPSQLQDVVILSDINKMGYDKWYNIILTYIKKGWL